MPIEPLSAHDARERHLQLVLHDGLGLRFNRPTDRTVWHYTNISGLNGIISSSALWASDYRYMNDASELSFGLEVLEMIIAHDVTNPKLSSDLRQVILREIALLKRSNMNLYVLTCSFCMRGNVLSQWRAYAQQDGIAIGFQKDLIETFASEQGFSTGIVYYYWSDSQKDLPIERRFPAWVAGRVGMLLDRIAALERAAQAFEIAQEHDDETVDFASLKQQGSIIRKWCVETAAFIKHPAFEEEQEWRCMKAIDETIIIGETKILHRASGSRIIPYVGLQIQNQTISDKAIRQLVIGPNVNGPATIQSVDFLVRRFGLNNVRIAMPFQPLRV